MGGGLSGLATGCYLQMNGYQTSLYEKNSEYGVFTHAWKRVRYLFNGAANWLAGAGAFWKMRFLLKELINFSKFKLIDPDKFISVENYNAPLHVFCDTERLKEEVLRVTPEDIRIISKYTSADKEPGTISPPCQKAPEQFNLWDYCTFLISQYSFIRFFMKWKKVPIRMLFREFKNSTLRELFLRIFLRHEHFSVLGVILTLGWMNIKSGGYQIGTYNKLIGKTLSETIDSVKNLFMTGKWVWAAGGIPGVIGIARHTAQIICHNDKKKFRVREN